jgi:hypothetical protein
MYVLVNGAFGVGKTAVARELQRQLSDAVLFDPERIGWVLKRLPGYHRSDFQHLAVWRRSTVRLARFWGRLHSVVIVPMAFSELRYLDEVRSGLAATGRPVHHYCLTAPLPVIQARLAGRGEPPGDPRWAWVHRRAAECCAVHSDPAFATQLSTEGRSPAAIAAQIASRLESAA